MQIQIDNELLREVTENDLQIISYLFSEPEKELKWRINDLINGYLDRAKHQMIHNHIEPEMIHLFVQKAVNVDALAASIMLEPTYENAAAREARKKTEEEATIKAQELLNQAEEVFHEGSK